MMEPMGRTNEDIQDELLVLECKTGDAEALRRLIERWQPRLARLARHLAPDRDGARDVVQEAWLAIVRGIGRLDDPARFRSWAYRITANKCADAIRRRSAQRSATDTLRNTSPRETVTAESETGPPPEAARLQAALRRLPAEQRAMLSLRYLDGMGMTEIAQVFEVPVGTVKSRLFHAREQLRDVLEREEP